MIYPGKTGQVSQIQTPHFWNTQTHSMPLIVLFFHPSFSFDEEVGILRGQVTNQCHRPTTGQN